MAIKWTLEKIKTGLEKFKNEHKRYPTASEVDASAYLPSTRQIQRRFLGGLPGLRKELNLSGPHDFTRGQYSSERAKKIGQRAHQLEREVYNYLIKQFGQVAVHREYLFTDDGRNRTDFFVYHKSGSFAVDIFYPADWHNLIGCLNSKLKAYHQTVMREYPVIFLMMNEAITEEEIVAFLARKKNKLLTNEHLMTLAEFRRFCNKREALKVISQ